MGLKGSERFEGLRGWKGTWNNEITELRNYGITVFRNTDITKKPLEKTHFVTVIIKLAMVIRIDVIEMAKDERFETSRLAARVPLGST